MDNPTPRSRSWWSKYRLPIILAIVALCLYAFSIYWIVYGQGQIA